MENEDQKREGNKSPRPDELTEDQNVIKALNDLLKGLWAILFLTYSLMRFTIFIVREGVSLAGLTGKTSDDINEMDEDIVDRRTRDLPSDTGTVIDPNSPHPDTTNSDSMSSLATDDTSTNATPTNVTPTSAVITDDKSLTASINFTSAMIPDISSTSSMIPHISSTSSTATDVNSTANDTIFSSYTTADIKSTHSQTANVSATSITTTDVKSARLTTLDVDSTSAMTVYLQTTNISQTLAASASSSSTEVSTDSFETSQENQPIAAEETKLNFLLMGKTGHGKSATGNSILNKKFFHASNNVSSCTKEVSHSFTQFGKYVLLVVDGPGLEDTDMNKAQDMENAERNMNTALTMCYGGVDAFLFVYRYPNRFTKEEQSALETLKGVFGETYMSHVIVVITCGDLFQDDMEDRNRDISIQEWCNEQTGEFQKLYKDCNGRFVLFNNKEKDECKKQAQIKRLVELAEDLQNNHGRYTAEAFKDAKEEREKLILNEKAPFLTEQIQQKVCLLNEDIVKLSTLSNKHKQRIKHRAEDLKSQINVDDNEHVDLNKLRKMINKVERHLCDLVKLRRQRDKLEKFKEATPQWTKLGAASNIISSMLSVPFIPMAAVAGLVKSGVEEDVLIETSKRLIFFLMGNRGEGKSVTGNTILNRKAFTSSTSLTERADIKHGDVEKADIKACNHKRPDVRVGYAELDNVVLKVVDGINLDINILDTSLKNNTAMQIMNVAVTKCCEGVDVFLLIIKFGSQFTAKDLSAVRGLKAIFGETYMEHMIVVITGGDLFKSDMKERVCGISFDEWCNMQPAEIQNLYRHCNGRFVLLNNKEKNEEIKMAQIQHLLQMAEDLKAKHGRYDSDCFQRARVERRKMIFEMKAPELKEDIQEKINLLTSDIDAFFQQYEQEKGMIVKRISDLSREIEIQDKGYNVLGDLRGLVDKVRENLDHVDTLQNLGQEMEMMRMARNAWAKIGSVCRFVGGVLKFTGGKLKGVMNWVNVRTRKQSGSSDLKPKQ